MSRAPLDDGPRCGDGTGPRAEPADPVLARARRAVRATPPPRVPPLA